MTRLNPTIKLIIFGSLAALTLLSACQTLPIGKTAPRENISLHGLEEYIALALDNGEFSGDTLFMLTEKYFEEESEILKERYAAYEAEKKLYIEKKLPEEPIFPASDHSRLIKGFKALLEKYPARPDMDKVLYVTGYALSEDGLTDEAIEAFEEFMKKYGGRNSLSTEVAFRLGELYFEKGDTNLALDLYAAVLKDAGSVFYEKALYKSAWVLYKVDDFEGALNYFIRLLDSAEAYHAEPTIAAAIKKESFNDATAILSRMQIPQEIEKTLAEIKDRPYAPDMLLSLSSLLNDENRHTQALTVLNLFIKTYPDSQRLPFVYSEMSRTHEFTGDVELALKGKEEMVEKFNPSSPWYKTNFPGGSSTLNAAVSDALIETAKYYHAKGNGGLNPAYSKKAVDLYKLYLSYFPGTEASKEVILLLGEASFDEKKYDEAIERYFTAMGLYKGTKEGENAAFSALLTLELIVSQGGFDERKIAEPLGRIKTAYLIDFKESRRLEEFLNKVSDVYSSIKRYGEATVALEPLFAGPARKKAYEKSGDIYVMEKDFLRAITSYEKSLSEGEEEGLKKKLSNIHYVAAEGSIKEGKKKEALEHYFRAFSTFKESAIAENALINAGRVYAESADLSGLISTVNLIKENYPASKGAFTLYLEAGKALEKNGKYAHAATMFENAIPLSSASDGEKLAFKSVDMLDKAGEAQKAEDFLSSSLARGLISSGGKAEALYRIGLARIKRADMEGAEKTFGDLLKEAKGSKDASGYEARAAFLLAGFRLEEYLKLKITEPFEKSLERKEALMKELLKDYTTTVRGGVQELLPESFHNMGTIFENFKDSLLNSERPSNLSAEELREYNFILDEKAYPLEEEAVTAYKNSVKAAMERSLNRGFVLKSLLRLKAIKPALYKRDFENGSALLIYTEPEPAELK